jgi:hypothetical protein
MELLFSLPHPLDPADASLQTSLEHMEEVGSSLSPDPGALRSCGALDGTISSTIGSALCATRELPRNDSLAVVGTL